MIERLVAGDYIAMRDAMLPGLDEDLYALVLCRTVGHAYEGIMIAWGTRGQRRCVGHCARCGIGLLTDGS